MMNFFSRKEDSTIKRSIQADITSELQTKTSHEQVISGNIVKRSVRVDSTSEILAKKARICKEHILSESNDHDEFDNRQELTPWDLYTSRNRFPQYEWLFNEYQLHYDKLPFTEEEYDQFMQYFPDFINATKGSIAGFVKERHKANGKRVYLPKLFVPPNHYYTNFHNAFVPEIGCSPRLKPKTVKCIMFRIERIGYEFWCLREPLSEEMKDKIRTNLNNEIKG